MGYKDSGFLSAEKDRLIVVLSLTVLYPVIAGSFFVLFLFWVLPGALSTAGAPAAILSPGYWLHGYWLVTALIWLILLAILLPLMGNANPPRNVSYKRESGVSVKEDAEMTQLKKTNPSSYGGAVTAAVKTAAPDDQSVTDASSDMKTEDELADFQEAITAAHSRDNLAVATRDNSHENSAVSLSERQKLTQSGEFLNDCLQESFKSEDDLRAGEIILGNTNCQVHSHGSEGSADSGSDDGLVDANVVLLPKESSERSPCHEPPHQKVDRESIRRTPRDTEKAELLLSKQETEQERDDETVPLSPGIEQTITINEAINEAIVQADKSMPKDALPHNTPALQTVEDETIKPDVLPQLLREKKRGLPSIDTSRASQVLCSAPSTLSPRESNMVFLYVNAEQEN